MEGVIADAASKAAQDHIEDKDKDTKTYDKDGKVVDTTVENRLARRKTREENSRRNSKMREQGAVPWSESEIVRRASLPSRVNIDDMPEEMRSQWVGRGGGEGAQPTDAPALTPVVGSAAVQ